ncbi:MAG: PP2C family protein-serine/threonine phosphatase [Flavobacteriales bacterium]|jgi:sigma-B regulation protein RsbU (phosphoserine phosphatase)
MAHSVERLEQRLEVQDYKLNALLDVTQGINARATEAELLEQYRVTLAENLGIHRLVLYANDDGWKCLLTNGVAGEIPAVLEASFFDKGGQVRLHSSQGNEDFDVVIPVLHNGAPIAYLLAGDTEEGTGVSPVVKHLRFIELLTNVLIVALQNKRLELERVRQEATRRELELAADLQSMLVPADWPRDRDVDVAAFYKPHLEVGGDYYDVFSVDEDRLVFCMADVSGKGIAAAFLMSNFQANLRAIFQYEPSDLAKVVTQLNKRVMDNAKGEKYITLFAAVYNRRDQSLQYINCGHNPPVLMSADGTTQQLELGCCGLGMFREIPSIEAGTVNIRPGATLLCYTDGLVEQENSDDVPFGMQRMEEVVRERRGMPVDAVQEALIEAVRTFKGSEPSFDDTALMVVRFK